MRACVIQLQNVDGSHCQWICAAEAKRMEEQGEIRRITKRKDPKQKYRYNPVADPSDSGATQCSVTLRDMQMAVGAQRLEEGREQEDFERLVGYGLIAVNARISDHGYLRA